MILNLTDILRITAVFLGLMNGTVWSTNAHGQQLPIGGVTEGEVVRMQPGTSVTNISVHVTPSVTVDPANAVFILEHQGSTIVNRTSPPPFSTTFSNLTVGKYFLTVRVQGMNLEVTSDVSFDVSHYTAPPSNDHWSNAAIIAAWDLPVSATNHQGTSEVMEPPHTGAGSGRSVWWRWMPLSNSVVTATTIGSTVDTTLAVYTGTNIGTLLPIVSNHDAGFEPNAFSQVTFSAVAGREYFLAVDSAITESGESHLGRLELRLLASSPPVIDVSSPPDGEEFEVAMDTSRTNALFMVSVTDSAAILNVRYALDGGGISESGMLSAPYVFSRTNLDVGDYWLSVMAMNTRGLIGVKHVGFSIVPVGARLLVTDYPALTTNAFRFAVTGRRGASYQVQASTNLDVWCSIDGYTNFPGAVKVADSNATNSPRRFYRAVPQ